jgi:glycosyltransferase involved in cell wall biosynthesis
MRATDIGIVTFPISEAGTVPLSHMVDIAELYSNKLTLITGGKGYERFKDDPRVEAFEVRHRKGSDAFTRTASYLVTQVKMAFRLARLGRRVDQWIFFMGCETLFLPMLAASLAGKRVVLVLTGSTARTNESQQDRLGGQLALLSRANYRLADTIVVYSPRLIDEYGLSGHREKVAIAHEHFLDTGRFRITKDFYSRGRVMGYVGRLAGEKGISSLIRAVPYLEEGIKLKVIGDGESREEVEELIRSEGVGSRVELLGWVDHDELPAHLNEMRLLVMPSLTEGLPNAMLEAMACGTPVIATPVGSIPDVITDGETGFILDPRSPASIASGITRALDHPGLETISGNCSRFVTNVFAFESTSSEWEKIIAGMAPRGINDGSGFDDPVEVRSGLG